MVAGSYSADAAITGGITGPSLDFAGTLAARASDRLRKEEMLVASFAGTRLRMELDKIPLWRGDYVSVSQLMKTFSILLPSTVNVSAAGYRWRCQRRPRTTSLESRVFRLRRQLR